MGMNRIQFQEGMSLFGQYADRYLGAIAYRFNRRFDLHALPARLLAAAVATGPRTERSIRLAETHR